MLQKLFGCGRADAVEFLISRGKGLPLAYCDDCSNSPALAFDKILCLGIFLLLAVGPNYSHSPSARNEQRQILRQNNSCLQDFTEENQLQLIEYAFFLAFLYFET